ncbi:NAD(P)-binding protein [Rhizodiscina lignyota]|uniref:NAD(P)-binding protein n=1 Tax=Rhizodiscina lignyota TaxID=1504668 RepID=A0A9P4M8L4_9PEZI|nr:NAD(P)-binding protein [Rhizodiscina lignyota]
MSSLHVLWGFLRNRWSAPSLDYLTPRSIAGRTVLVTGASTGLGLEAARHYARLGATRIILGVRPLRKGETAKQNIEDSLQPSTSSKHEDAKGTTIEVWELDLASFASVYTFVERVLKELDSLDIAVLNAAVSKTCFSFTDDGWEETLQVNTLSNILRAQLILPKLRASRRKSDTGDEWIPKLEFLASQLNWLAALNKPETFDGTSQRYGISKLFLIYCVREIATSLSIDEGGRPEVVVNYSCPGACKSELAREWHTSWVKSFVLWVLQATICKTTEEGSRTLVYATCLEEEGHGKWIHNDAIEAPGKLVESDLALKWQKRVWDEVGQVLQGTRPTSQYNR